MYESTLNLQLSAGKTLATIIIFLFTINNQATIAQVDTEFWFVVPELSHRGNTGGTPGALRFATLEQPATVTVGMPANPFDAVNNPSGFKDTIFNIPANSSYLLDLTYLIDVASNP